MPISRLCRAVVAGLAVAGVWRARQPHRVRESGRPSRHAVRARLPVRRGVHLPDGAVLDHADDDGVQRDLPDSGPVFLHTLPACTGTTQQAEASRKASACT